MFVNVYKTEMDKWFDLVAFCDDKPLDYCFEVDTSKGYAICYVVDAAGMVVLQDPKDPSKGIKTVHHRGMISLLPRERKPPAGTQALPTLAPTPRRVRAPLGTTLPHHSVL